MTFIKVKKIFTFMKIFFTFMYFLFRLTPFFADYQHHRNYRNGQQQQRGQ